MDDCIFCKIIKGEIPSYTIYEDEVVKVFLDINPVTNGHALVIPKKHFKDFEEIDLDTLAHMDKVAKELFPKLKEVLGCSGITRVQNNGLGQDVKHYHMHLIPRYENDNVEMKSNKDLIVDAGEIFSKF